MTRDSSIQLFMSIKSRILLSVIILQLTGFLVVIFQFSGQASRSLLENGQQQIRTTLQSRLKHFDSLANEMERSARALALAGELLHQQRQQLSREQAQQRFSSLLKKTFTSFPQALGGGIWFEPYQFFPEQRLMGPYVYRNDKTVRFSWELNTPEYNYPAQSWYQQALPDNWQRDNLSGTMIHWSAPYTDDAASQSLMMTVTALMFDPQGKVIGLASVDWSIEDARRFLSQSGFTDNSRPFLFHPDDNVPLLDNHFSGPADSVSAVLSNTAVRLSDSTIGSVTDFQITHQDASQIFADTSIRLSNTPGLNTTDFQVTSLGERLYAGRTATGLVLGVIVPEADFARVINQQRQETLTMGVGIALLFVAIMALLLEVLFQPFEQILTLLRSTVDSNDNQQQIHIRPIAYPHQNEFTPIITTFNVLVKQIDSFTRRLSESNEELTRQQTKIAELNTRLEEKVEERTQELNAKKEEALRSLQQLKLTQAQLINMEKYAAMGELVAGLAHEVNTPLGVSVTAVSALEEQLNELNRSFRAGKLDKAEFNDFIEFSQEGTQIAADNLRRAADMISRFKQVAVDQASEKQRDFELGDYINSIITSLRPNYKYRPLEVRVDCPEKIYISGYPGALSQILTNLMMNALIHAFGEGQQGHIDISIRCEGDQIRLRFSDDGSGMDQATLDHLFEPFFTTRRADGGSGMGTHIIHQLVTETLQGSIDVSSSPGQGTHYQLLFPRQLSQHRVQETPPD